MVFLKKDSDDSTLLTLGSWKRLKALREGRDDPPERPKPKPKRRTREGTMRTQLKPTGKGGQRGPAPKPKGRKRGPTPRAINRRERGPHV